MTGPKKSLLLRSGGGLRGLKKGQSTKEQKGKLKRNGLLYDCTETENRRFSSKERRQKTRREVKTGNPGKGRRRVDANKRWARGRARASGTVCGGGG